MGTMIPEPCEHFRGLIAMEVVGQLSVHERVALSAHTEGCSACRDERQELMMLSMVLGTADPDHFVDDELPFALQTAVLDRLRGEERAERRAQRSRYVVGSVAAVLVAATVLALTLAWPSGPVTKTVALHGLPPVHATARLTAEPWGTAMELHESGEPPGEVLTVSVRTVSGLVVADRDLPHRGRLVASHHGLCLEDVEDHRCLGAQRHRAGRHARLPLRRRGRDLRAPPGP